MWGAESVRGMSAGGSERWRGAVSSAWSLLGDTEAHGVWVSFPKPATPRLPALSLQQRRKIILKLDPLVFSVFKHTQIHQR